MHFAFIATLLPPAVGGSECLWSQTAIRALDGGHRVDVFVSERSSLEPFLQEIRAKGGTIHFWKVKHPPHSLLGKVVKKIRQRGLPEWEWWHRNLPRNVDVICLNQGGILCGLKRHGLCEAIASTEKPYVCLARADEDCDFLTPRTRPFAKRFFEGASCIVGASRSTIDLLRLYLPSDLSQALVLHSPIRDYGEIVDFYPSDDVIRFACVGRLNIRDKGQHSLLSCLASEKWQARPFTLAIYGDGPDREYLSELIGFFNLSDKVEIAGQTGDIADVWRRAHMAVQPSKSEGTPQSLLEAMLCRRPSVATAVSGIPEWVEEGRTGFLAEGSTVRHLDAALERAWANRHSWQAMGEMARKTCVERRDPDPSGTLLSLLIEAARSP